MSAAVAAAVAQADTSSSNGTSSSNSNGANGSSSSSDGYVLPATSDYSFPALGYWLSRMVERQVWPGLGASFQELGGWLGWQLLQPLL
jgi:hypothetical protein